MNVEIIILAMVAAFVGLRLYAVLGRRTDSAEDAVRRRIEQPDPASAPRRVSPLVAETPAMGETTPGSARAALAAGAKPQFTAEAEPGVRALVSADRRFDVAQFLAGARNAYGLVLDAFWRGDRAELAQLCDRAVFEGFSAAITARETAGETVEARLIRIEDADIVAATLDGQLARVTVRFRADIASVTRNADGNVIAGTLNDAVESHDVWTFTRNLAARDPDWQLEETDFG